MEMKQQFLLLILIFQAYIAFAQPTSPTQPEFTKFQPIGNDNLVDTYSGGFNYNIVILTIPGEDGFDFPINLFYNSDVGYGEEASWVGYGWNLNAGSITRQTRGFPDDMKNYPIQYFTKSRPIRSYTVGLDVGLEFYSKADSDDNIKWNELLSRICKATTIDSTKANGAFGIGPKLGFSYTWHNRKGHIFDFTWGISADLFSVADISYGQNSSGDFTGNFSISPGNLFRNELSEATTKFERGKIQFKQKSFDDVGRQLIGHYAYSSYPVFTHSYHGTMTSGTYAVRWDPIPKIGVNTGFNFSSTEIFTLPFQIIPAYGYMYNEEGRLKSSAKLDYYVEKDMGFVEQDKFLGVPFSNKDMFIVAGHGISGSFSLRNGVISSFRPNKQSSVIIGSSSTVGVNAGSDFGPQLTASMGVPLKKTTISGWAKDAVGPVGHYSESSIAYLRNKPLQEKVFRFHGDLGGEVDFGNDIPIAAELAYCGAKYHNQLHEIKLGRIDLNDMLHYKAPIGKGMLSRHMDKFVITGSKHIQYVTRQDIIDEWQKFVEEYATEHGKQISSLKYSDLKDIPSIAYYDRETLFEYCSGNQFIDFTAEDGDGRIQYPNAPFLDKASDDYNASIVQIIITNEVGNKYVYGLPVYHRNEMEVTYGFAEVNPAEITSNTIIHTEVKDDNKNIISKNGHFQSMPYAGTFLLTSVLSSDYIDMKLDGPTPDDLGSYVKLEYDRAAGTNNKFDTDTTQRWYQWRNPYTGLHYNKGTLTDPKDDTGSFTSGERESYYLKEIHTKSHYALFKKSNRADGLGANPNYTLASKNASAIAITNDNVWKLDAVHLYSKQYIGDIINNTYNSTLIKTVCFDYNNEVQSGTNSELRNTTGDITGKTTLKKLWYEYGGTKEPYISPYQFDYKYDLADLTSCGSLYDNIRAEYDGINETPEYQEWDIDAWGNYQEGLDSNKINLFTSVDQTPDTTSFDPAAWKLKNITLPSGGEIKINYEQDDYQFVHNRSAMGLATITSYDEGEPESIELSYSKMRWTLGFPNNVSNGATDQYILSLVEKLNAMKDRGERLYFKVLVNFKGVDEVEIDANINNCRSEYITGYGGINMVSTTSTGVKITFNSTPISDAMDQFKKANRGRTVIGSKCECTASYDNNASAHQVFNQMGDAIDFLNNNANISPVLNSNGSLSYVRIPLPIAKKGGGVRVKRILYYDGFDNMVGTDPGRVYGKEYIYKLLDGTSSGVASNEPAINRNENPLIQFLKSRHQNNDFKQFFNGKVRTDFEGLYGESILPGAKVGYSRVVAKDIHPYKSCEGFIVNNYYTYKDYPFDFDFYDDSTIARSASFNTKIQKQSFSSWMFALLATRMASEHYAFQGHRFITTDIPGHLKNTITYNGQYKQGDLSKNGITAKVEYSYFDPGTEQSVYQEFKSPKNKKLGREVEIIEERCKVEEKINKLNIDFDCDILATLIPLPLPSLFPTYNVTDNKVYKHSMNKVVSYPAIVREVRQYKDGIEHITRNKVFDKFSGQVAVTESLDEFDKMDNTSSGAYNGSIKTFTKPAYMEYPKLGIKSYSQGLQLNRGASPCLLFEKNGEYYLQSYYLWKIAALRISDILTEGDIILIESRNNKKVGYAIVEEPGDDVAKIRPFCTPNSSGSFNMSLLGDYEDDGAFKVKVRIIRSGRDNRLTEPAEIVSVYAKHEDYLLRGDTIRAIGVLPSQQRNAEYLLIDSLNSFLKTLECDKVKEGDEHKFVYAGYSQYNNFVNSLEEPILLSSNGGEGIYVRKWDSPDSDSVYYRITVKSSNNYYCANVSNNNGYVFGHPKNINYHSYFYIDNGNRLELNDSIRRRTFTNENGTSEWYVGYPTYGFSFSDKDMDTYWMKANKVLSAAVFTYQDTIVDNTQFLDSIGLADKMKHDSYFKRVKPAKSLGYKARNEDNPNLKLQQHRGILDSFAFFNWKRQEYNDSISKGSGTQFNSTSDMNDMAWLKTNEITGYNQHGKPTEYKDMNDIYSVAKTYLEPELHNLTKLVAVNAEADEVEFTSFEEVGTEQISKRIAHSGETSFKIPNTVTSSEFFPNIITNSPNVVIRFWACRDDREPILSNQIQCGGENPTEIKRVGDWTLFELSSGISSLTLKNLCGSDLYIDDLRVQPADSRMQCYVYDNQWKIVSILDNQNLATFYQYNMKGELVRNVSETERGIRTVTEQHINSKKIPREANYNPGGWKSGILIPNDGKDSMIKMNNYLKNYNQNSRFVQPANRDVDVLNSSFDIFKYKYKDGKTEAEVLDIDRKKIDNFFKSKQDSIENVLPGLLKKNNDIDKNEKGGQNEQ